MGLDTYFKQVLGLQAIIALIVTSTFMTCFGVMAGWSALIASIVFYLPHMLFGKMLFSRSGASQSKYILGQFFRGEFLKIALSVVLFAAVFKWHWAQGLPFFMAYIIMYLTTIIIAQKTKIRTS